MINKELENYTILLYLAVALTLLVLILLQILHCVVKLVNFTLENLTVVGNCVLGNTSITIGLIYQIAQTVITIYQSLSVLIRQYHRNQTKTRYQHILSQEEWHGWWDLENLTHMRTPGR